MPLTRYSCNQWGYGIAINFRLYVSLFLHEKIKTTESIADHPRSGVVCDIGRVSAFVCLESIAVESSCCTSGISPEIRVKFVYEGHRVKVKVTGAIKVENPYPRNVKRLSARTPVLKHRARAMKFARSVDFSSM